MNYVLIQEWTDGYNVEVSWDDEGVYRTETKKFDTYTQVLRFVKRYLKFGRVE